MFGGQILIFGQSVSPLIVLLIVALAFVLIGYALGASFSTRWMRSTDEQGQKKGQRPAFLKGISSMLAQDTDKAIAELTQAVELDSETVETYIALGHLYRSKGIFDRAISLRQSIIARPRLAPGLKIQALYDLGVDYRMGGFLSRAIETFEQVLAEDGHHQAALRDLVQVYEEIQDWDQALEAQKRLDKLTGRSNPTVLAHLHTERGKGHLAAGDQAEAKASFKKALSLDKNSVPALLALGDLFLAQGEVKTALQTWRRIAAAAPRLAYMALERVIERDWTGREAEAVEEFIEALAAESKDPWVQFLAARHLAARGKEKETVAALRKVFELAPGFLPAHRDLGLILMDQGQIDEILTAYQNLLGQLPGSRREFECRHCGYRPGELEWKCPSCRQWGTIDPVN